MNIVASDKVVSICSFHRREDKMPSKYSRVCSCHFRSGKNSNGPEIFERNREKLFPEQRGSPPKKKAKTETAFKGNTLTEMIEDARKNESLSTEKSNGTKAKNNTGGYPGGRIGPSEQRSKKCTGTDPVQKQVLHCGRTVRRCCQNGNWASYKGSISNCCDICLEV